MYFAPYESWMPSEKEAIGYARGRTLDVGCGAGRVCLYLQEKGQDVLGIDNSPGALEVCRQRGVKETRLLSITKISRQLGSFETIVMFGNNFGLLGNPSRAKFLLKRLNHMTSPAGRILAVSNDIYQTSDPDHLAYHEYNRRRGRMAGQIRIRVRFKHATSPWFDYLLVSPEEMAEILEGTGWSQHRVISAEGTPVYAAVLIKERHPIE
jgi:SAM-dependent methyltransferase